MFTDRPASIASKEVTTIGGCLRFELMYRQKEKGGVDSPPFALLPNCFYIKKHITCKEKSGSGSVSGYPNLSDLTSVAYETTVENLNEHSVRNKNSGAFRLLFLGGRFPRRFPESNCVHDVLFCRSELPPYSALDSEDITDRAVLCGALGGCF
jgi:hypothetical protein